MSAILIKHGTIITENSLLKDTPILINDGIISKIGKRAFLQKGVSTIDAKGCFVAPGFVDTHIHGDPASILSRELKNGTASIVVAVSCCSLKALSGQIRRINIFKKEDPLGRCVLGVRLEGPYINKEKAGAQDKKYIKKPSLAGLKQIFNISGPLLKMVTIAPELKGAGSLIRLLRSRHLIASMGHSNATYKKAAQGLKTGARHVTHLFNAMSRDPGVAGSALFGRGVKTEIIIDDVHVHPAHVDLVLRAKEIGDIIAITDSIAARPNKSKKSGGVYRLPDGTVAGSMLTMIGALRNLVLRHGLSIPEAVRLVSLNPARLLGLGNRKGSIATGKDADITVFDKDFNVKMTMVRGKIVHRKRGF